MTRFASIIGVATVATLVLLSGCEQAVETDYTKKLDGTWTVTGLMVTVPNPVEVPGAPGTIDLDTNVTVTIDDGDGLNTGTFSITIAQIVPPMPDHATTAIGSGSIKAESSSVLKVTLTEIMGPTLPAGVTGLKDVEQTLGYDLDGNSLKVSGAVLHLLNITSSATEELELTKQ